MAGQDFNRFICKHGVDHAHDLNIFFSKTMAQGLWFTATVARVDVDFILQHDLYVGVGYYKLWYCYEASYVELVDYRNCGTSTADGEAGNYFVGFRVTQGFAF